MEKKPLTCNHQLWLYVIPKKLLYFNKPSLLILFIVCVCLSKSSNAQVQTDTSFRTQMNAIFGTLDNSKIPYGILRDYAMELTNLECYNGTTALVDSNRVTPPVFSQVYYTLLSGKIATTATGFVKADTLDKRWFTARQAGRITLTGLFFNYSRFKDNAYPNYITVTSNKLYDKYVSGVWQNPYQSEKAFAISPSVNSYDSLGFKVILPANLWFTNTTTNGISINFNDGLGYRSITLGTLVSVSYTSYGTKEWVYRLALAGGGYIYSHSFIEITNGGSY